MATTTDNLLDISPKITLGKNTKYVPTRNMLLVLVAQKKLTHKLTATYQKSTVVVRKVCGATIQRRAMDRKAKWHKSCPAVIQRGLPFNWFTMPGMVNRHSNLPLVLIHFRALTHNRCLIFRKA
mmetsp:Transcript_14571/g.29512  ORF Transcript_14571/g.29512 Transcript_14571/m.29512 type:complete len:124 (-) Transcript_14571:110-481(-)